MKTSMAKSPQDISSKRHFHWTNKVSNEDEEVPTCKSSNTGEDDQKEDYKVPAPEPAASASARRKKLQAVAVSRLRLVLTAFRRNRTQFPLGLGSRVVVVWSEKWRPGWFELRWSVTRRKRRKRQGLLEEPLWRTFCNGKKSGFATRRECGPKEWKVLKAVEPISMGAGVLPGNGDGAENDGEIMYMRAKFERVVGSRDSEAFYMMNPDSNGAPELSIYLLRV
ncbi:hypothetical protein F0562_023548 [Nyssa sinensis]|uniref:Protein MIZU-KUSSEI 1 n=1 Tax=Nyssa sinensis TaxID=561372 RepID=A0A5J5BI27_9ASTE|nr:hypothetical protein F0562_023548 [Nyssa sinensis]